MKKDVDFIDKLKNDYLDEVFTWLCLGAKKWCGHKYLDPPKSVHVQPMSILMI